MRNPLCRRTELRAMPPCPRRGSAVLHTHIAGYVLGLGVDAVGVMCVLVLGAQFGETVLPVEAAQQPGPPLGGGAIASGQLFGFKSNRWIVEVRCRMVASRSWRAYRRFTWEGANLAVPL
jgi:hypothetical protein